MRKLIRRAILIGHPGPEDRFLPGVGQDIDNMSCFLPSPPGGGWRQDEISVLWPRTKEEVIKAVQNVVADYLLVYYSGHGAGQLVSAWTGTGWGLEVQRWLEVSPGVYIKDVDLINERVTRQLIICDCCRTRAPARISGIPEYLEKIPFTTEEVETAAACFDALISSSPAGRIIVHSTIDCRPAMDSNEGGMFSLALLLGALRTGMGTAYSGISVESLVEYAKTLLGMGEDSQVPEIAYKTGAMTVPFALNALWPGKAVDNSNTPRMRRASKPAYVSAYTVVGSPAVVMPERNAAKKWLALGGIALAVWLLAGGD